MVTPLHGNATPTCNIHMCCEGNSKLSGRGHSSCQDAQHDRPNDASRPRAALLQAGGITKTHRLDSWLKEVAAYFFPEPLSFMRQAFKLEPSTPLQSLSLPQSDWTLHTFRQSNELLVSFPQTAPDSHSLVFPASTQDSPTLIPPPHAPSETVNRTTKKHKNQPGRTKLIRQGYRHRQRRTSASPLHPRAFVPVDSGGA